MKIAIVLIFVLCCGTVFAGPLPETEAPNPPGQNDLEFAQNLRLFYGISPDFKVMLEGTLNVYKNVSQVYHSGVRLGAYYRIIDEIRSGSFRFGLKAGIFFQNLNRRIADNSMKNENEFTEDLTPVFQFSKNIVFETKFRLEQNLERGWDTIKIKPKLSYIFFNAQNEFLFDLNLGYEIYNSYNYGSRGESWLYAGANILVAPHLFFSPFYARKSWGSGTFTAHVIGSSVIIDL